MTQYDVLKVLESDKNRWFTALEIKQKVNVSAVYETLKRLRHWNLVEFKNIVFSSDKTKKIIYSYKYKENDKK